MRAAEAVAALTGGRGAVPEEGARGRAYAPANIALVKYWGKRDEALNLPVTGSLSISLGELGSHVELSVGRGGADTAVLNGRELPEESAFARRASAWYDLFRPAGMVFHLEARNTVPTAAGFASSASGFAALAKAANALFGWGLSVQGLSVLARLGSGSAARSVEEGFVEWAAGERADGMDSYATRLDAVWPSLRIGALVLCGTEKPVGSREGMRRSVETCSFYPQWPGRVAEDLVGVKAAIAARNIAQLGAVAEGNALAMHALMLATRPPVLYFLPESLDAMRRVWAAREAGVDVWFTMDAGPNLKLIFSAEEEERVRGWFPEIRVVAPFAAEATGAP